MSRSGFSGPRLNLSVNNVGLRAGQKILLVGNPDVVHVGAHLHEAAKRLGLGVRFFDTNNAFAGPVWLRRFHWWLRGHRPLRLREFSQQVVQACREFQPRWVLSTGLAPIEDWALTAIGKIGVQRLNYLTDDPFNPVHRTSWFMKALPIYDHVFSPRKANLEDLRQLGCANVSYLPFAYAPRVHFPEPPTTVVEREQWTADLVFAGGADRDRVPYMAALIGAGFHVVLYGGYWERYRATKAHGRGLANPAALRKALGGAKVVLCLVRRANRDGHVMRTFEVPAVGACMLTEDTEEHREIFGAEGKTVVYFRTTDEMLKKLRWLLAHEEERQRLARAAHELIINGGNTYQDRLLAMLSPPNVPLSQN